MPQSFSNWEAFLLGAASVLDLSGQFLAPDSLFMSDAEAIRSDFEQVGADIRWAMSQEPVELVIETDAPSADVQPLLPGILK